MPPTKIATPPPSAALTPRDMTWRHYAEIMDRFRKLCQPDVKLFQQAEGHILAKRVVDEWERNGRPLTDAGMIAKRMTEYQLDEEDNRQVDALYRRKLAFRERVTNALGKLPTDGWDVFYHRNSTSRKVPHTVRQWELASGGKP